MHITDIAPEHVRYVLLSRYAEGNVNKAVELMRFQRDAFSGVILPYNPNTKMQGAENRFFVTCYLDSLLFAMFARLQAFDCMLKTDLPDGPARKLAALLRLWVNMLRSGKLIHADMVGHFVGFPLLALFADASRWSTCRNPWRSAAGPTPG